LAGRRPTARARCRNHRRAQRPRQTTRHHQHAKRDRAQGRGGAWARSRRASAGAAFLRDVFLFFFCLFVFCSPDFDLKQQYEHRNFGLYLPLRDHGIQKSLGRKTKIKSNLKKKKKKIRTRWTQRPF
jgi:hypothetical protein